MDADLVILLRFVERALAVAIGGLAIYLGYRLFRLVPESKNSEGRVTLAKDFSVVISRVGPGVFFALFGALAVAYSLHEDVSVTLSPIVATEQPQAVATFTGAATPLPRSEADAKADRRMLLRRDIAVLNTMPKLLDPTLPSHERGHVERAIERIKLELMRPVWGDSDGGWGTPEDFELWLVNRPTEEPPTTIVEAIRFFNHPSRENPQ